MGTHPNIHHVLQFVYFPQEVRDASELTLFALQKIALFEQWELEKELHFLDVPVEVLWQPFETLSGGEQTKVLLALLFLDEDNFPLIDEPTNHLDAKSREVVSKYLKNKRQGFLLTSHYRAFVDEVVDHVLAMEKTNVKLYKGNFSLYEHEKGIRDARERAENEQLKKEISRLKQTAREKSDWSRAKEKEKRGAGDKGFVGARAARMMKKSKNLEKRMTSDIERKSELLKEIEDVDRLRMNYSPTHRKRLMTLENFEIGYSENPLFQPVSFELIQGDILVLSGENGSGKTSLIRSLFESEHSSNCSGHVEIVPNLKISYVRQNYADNKGTLKEFAEKKGCSFDFFLNNLRKLGMEREVFLNKIEHMSMGQQKKVELARSLTEEAELYIWDEPLNYLDVFNHQQIESLLKEVRPSMILIEHDKTFIEAVGTKRVELKPLNE